LEPLRWGLEFEIFLELSARHFVWIPPAPYFLERKTWTTTYHGRKFSQDDRKGGNLKSLFLENEIERIRGLLIPYGLRESYIMGYTYTSLLGHTIRLWPTVREFSQFGMDLRGIRRKNRISMKVFGIEQLDEKIFKIGEFSEKDAERIFTDIYTFECNKKESFI